MLDTSKIPHLEPQKHPVPAKNSDIFQQSLFQQIAGVFSGKKGVLLFCTIALLIYFSVCFQGERVLRAGLYAVLKNLGTDGFGVTYKAPSSYSSLKSGVNVDDLTITAPERMGGWVLKTGRITLSANPFIPKTVSIKLNGTHSLTTRAIGDIRLIVGEGEVTLNLPSKKGGASVIGKFKNIQTGAPKSMDGFSIALWDFKATASNTDGYTYTTASENIHLPAYLAQYLPENVEYLHAEGTISGIKIQSTRPFLSEWANDGGTVEVKHGEMIWKPFMAEINGTFGLNSSFELIGASVAKVYDLFDLLDRFEKGGYIRPSQVSMAKVVLGKKMTVADGEDRPSIVTPFSFQAGKIYAGPVLLYDKNAEAN